MSNRPSKPFITALKLTPNDEFYAQLKSLSIFKIKQQISEENCYFILKQLRAQSIPANIVWVKSAPYIVTFEESLDASNFYLIHYDRKGKPYLSKTYIEFQRADIQPKNILQGNLSRLGFLFLRKLNLRRKIPLKKIRVEGFGSKIKIMRFAVLSITSLNKENSLILHGNLVDKIFVGSSLEDYISEFKMNSTDDNLDLDDYLRDLLSKNIAYRPRTNLFPFTMRLVPTGNIYWELNDVKENGKIVELEYVLNMVGNPTDVKPPFVEVERIRRKYPNYNLLFPASLLEPLIDMETQPFWSDLDSELHITFSQLRKQPSEFNDLINYLYGIQEQLNKYFTVDELSLKTTLKFRKVSLSFRKTSKKWTIVFMLPQFVENEFINKLKRLLIFIDKKRANILFIKDNSANIKTFVYDSEQAVELIRTIEIESLDKLENLLLPKPRAKRGQGSYRYLVGKGNYAYIYAVIDNKYRKILWAASKALSLAKRIPLQHAQFEKLKGLYIGYIASLYRNLLTKLPEESKPFSLEESLAKRYSNVLVLSSDATFVEKLGISVISASAMLDLASMSLGLYTKAKYSYPKQTLDSVIVETIDEFLKKYGASGKRKRKIIYIHDGRASERLLDNLRRILTKYTEDFVIISYINNNISRILESYDYLGTINPIDYYVFEIADDEYEYVYGLYPAKSHDKHEEKFTLRPPRIKIHSEYSGNKVNFTDILQLIFTINRLDTRLASERTLVKDPITIRAAHNYVNIIRTLLNNTKIHIDKILPIGLIDGYLVL